MTNLATGKQFPDGGKMVSRRDFGRGLAAIFAAGCAPALLGQTARGLMHRNLGGRIATFSKSKPGIPDWITPLLSAYWPNGGVFAEYESDNNNYIDIYSQYGG